MGKAVVGSETFIRFVLLIFVHFDDFRLDCLLLLDTY
jgi:hypothetical protein